MLNNVKYWYIVKIDCCVWRNRMGKKKKKQRKSLRYQKKEGRKSVSCLVY